ncbi:MAG: 5-(carboxyamino)imidazole ribonucleotide synthase [Acidimicrobiia bacterium]
MTISVAVLGGGQLGRMLGLAAIPLGIEVRFLDPAPNPPAQAVGPCVTAALDDLAAIDAFIEGATVVTYEWEGVPAAIAEHIASRVPIAPGPMALARAQDRLAEKELFASLDIPTAPYRRVDSLDALHDAVRVLGTPALLKTRTGGYDGKGQARINDESEIARAWDEIGQQPAILEGWVPFAFECSIIAARRATGEVQIYAIPENTHRNGILRTSIVPAPKLAPELQTQGDDFIRRLLDALDYVGVIALECFVTSEGLVANEFAPRVHNSGHWTIEGAQTSQFEQHVRAICDLPLGSPALVGASAMLNCIGALPDSAGVLAIPGAHLHTYGKAPRLGRKVGHVTVTAADFAELERRVEILTELLPSVG